MTPSALAGIGHNEGPETPGDALTLRLKEDHGKEMARAEALIAASTRLPAKAGEEEAQKLTDYIGQINVCFKNIEKARDVEKQPFLEGGRVVDGLFNDFKSRLNVAKAMATKIVEAYAQEKRAEEAKRREEEAKRQRDEAAKKLADAASLESAHMTPQAQTLMNQAIKADNTAQRLEQSVQSGQGLGVVKGETGVKGVTSKRWVGEIESTMVLDLEALRNFIKAEHLQSAINAFVANGGRELKGARIYEKETFAVRS